MENKINELKEILNEMLGKADADYNKILQVSQELDIHIVKYYEIEELKRAM